MRASNKESRKVKPQGSIGDRKNDGFIPSLGKYYQAYSPQCPTGNPASAISKLENDLDGLIEYWRNEHNFDVKEFYFVYNDKYHGAHPQIYTTLSSVKNKHKLDVCDVFLASELEDIFIEFIDNSVVAEIVGYVSENYGGFSDSQTNEPTDFINKIHFNKLGENTARHLNLGAYQLGYVEDYFCTNSNFSRQQARDSLNKMYPSGDHRLA